ncbi:MAG: hypothetical protein EOP05_07630, partial [Proteobacteria bacterium]
MGEDLELLKAFLAESSEILSRMEMDVGYLRADPTDLNVVNSLFRGVHTIKGNSSFLDLTNVTALSHAAETLLDKSRQGELAASAALPEIMQQ